MAITDLLSRIPFPPALRRGGADSAVATPVTAWTDYSAPAAFEARTPVRSASMTHTPTAVPSWAILAMTALALACLSLAAALVIQNAELSGSPADPSSGYENPDLVSTGATAGGAVSGGGGTPNGATPVSAPQTTVTAQPTPVPADVLARLEAAGNEPLHNELTQLLGAIEIGFGSASSQLDPALRSYTTRMASRFEWNPDTFRVSVTSSDPEIAEARAGTLRRLFGTAISSGRLVIEPGTGPDALTLVSH